MSNERAVSLDAEQPTPALLGRLDTTSLLHALATLAHVLAPYLRAELFRSSRSPDQEVDLGAVPEGKRRAYQAARTGQIEGAFKRKRQWFAPEAGYHAWADSITIRPTAARQECVEAPTKSGATVSSIDAMRERLGLRRGAP